MKRIIAWCTVAALFAALMALSAVPVLAAGSGGASCTTHPQGCKTTSTVNSTPSSSTVKKAGNSAGFQSTSTVVATTSTIQRGNIGAGTKSTTTTTPTTTIPGPCVNPGGQPNGGPCR